LAAGDQAAAAHVFRRFAERLLSLARSHLDGRVRQKMDPDDVVQSAFRTFFRRQADNAFDLTTWDSLWALLVVITLRKCSRQAAHFHGPNHDVRRETSPAADSDDAFISEAIDREPTPEEAAALADLVERLMRSLRERQRRVLELRLQGFTVAEISEQLGRTEHTVEGMLRGIRAKARQLLKENEG
jgi:RNA polymerase sigma-70 factor (ECF subfamily)